MRGGEMVAASGKGEHDHDSSSGGCAAQPKVRCTMTVGAFVDAFVAWVRQLASILPERYAFAIVMGGLGGVGLNAVVRAFAVPLVEYETTAISVFVALGIAKVIDARSPRAGFRDRLAAVEVLFDLGKIPPEERSTVCRAILSYLTQNPALLMERAPLSAERLPFAASPAPSASLESLAPEPTMSSAPPPSQYDTDPPSSIPGHVLSVATPADIRPDQP